MEMTAAASATPMVTGAEMDANDVPAVTESKQSISNSVPAATTASTESAAANVSRCGGDGGGIVGSDGGGGGAAGAATAVIAAAGGAGAGAATAIIAAAAAAGYGGSCEGGGDSEPDEYSSHDPRFEVEASASSCDRKTAGAIGSSKHADLMTQKESSSKRAHSGSGGGAASFVGEEQTEVRDARHFVHSIPEIVDRMAVEEVVGTGAFSTVFRGVVKRKNGEKTDRAVALKCILPSSNPTRISREIQCLKKLEGKHNVATLYAVVHHNDAVVLVLNYFAHRPFKEYSLKMDLPQIRSYCHGLMDALCYIHSKGIIHRDIKPNNFFYNNGKFLLVDFGLAQLEGDENVVATARKRKRGAQPSRRATPSHGRPTSARNSVSGARSGRAQHSTLTKSGVKTEDKRNRDHVNRAGTRGFRPPEVLLRYEEQTPAIDVWAAGIILFSILSGRFPLFAAEDDINALQEIADMMGRDRLQKVARAFGKEWIGSAEGCSAPPPLSENKRDKKDSMLVWVLLKEQSENFRLPAHLVVPNSTYRFLAACLRLHPGDRITAEKALEHDFLKEV